MKKIFVFLLILINFLIFSQDPIELYKKAKESFFLEKYEEAIYYLKKSLDINPNYIEALLEISKLYYELEIYDYAYDYIQKALKLFPKRDDIIIFCANIETKLERYDVAEKRYKSVIDKNPLNIDAYNGLANLYLITNRNLLAKKTLDNVLKTDKNNFFGISMMAKYYEPIDKKKAEYYYIMNIESNSLNPEAYYQYSIFNFRNNNIAKAIENINISINISKKTKYKKVLGKYYLFLNRGDDALKLYREILQNENENNYLNYYHLAFSYYIISDYNNAIISLKKSLGLRDDDEISQFFLDTILINKYDVDYNQRINNSNYHYNKAIKSKSESNFLLYLYYLKQSIRSYPKNVLSRVELAEYYKTQNFLERYINELKIAVKYSNDINLKDKLEIEENGIYYKLGDDWNVNQYDIENSYFKIPLFIIREIENPHYNFERLFGKILETISYEKTKFVLELFDEKDYTDAEKINICRQKKSPFYLNFYVSEVNNSINAKIDLYNSINNELIKQFKNYQIGNDRIINTSYQLINNIDNEIPFMAKIIKIRNDKALINAGKRSGIKIKDNFIILKNNNYNLEKNRAKFIYTTKDIKGKGIAIKVDENITELIIQEDKYFKDVDVDDIIIY